MIRLLEYREQFRQGGVIAALVFVLCVVMIYHFTERTSEGAERERAHIVLRRMYDLQQTYRAQYGTYLAIDREKNGDVLQLTDAPGAFQYRVVVFEGGFIAYAEADFDGDGQSEVWQMDAADPEPVLVQRD